MSSGLPVATPTSFRTCRVGAARSLASRSGSAIGDDGGAVFLNDYGTLADIAGPLPAATVIAAANLDDIDALTATLEVMRFVLALLAVIGLLASSAAAAAAQATCHSRGGEMMMPMAVAMADMSGATMGDSHKPDPCCNPGKDQVQKKHSDAECAQTCAAMCGIIAALPSAHVAFLALPDRGTPPQARVASLKPHEPSRLERPPRSIA